MLQESQVRADLRTQWQSVASAARRDVGPDAELAEPALAHARTTRFHKPRADQQFFLGKRLDSEIEPATWLQGRGRAIQAGILRWSQADRCEPSSKQFEQQSGGGE